MPRAAIVGYTNAGKSSILNALAKAEVLAEDKLFATLDPTTRRVSTSSGPILLTDTVGFVRKLPHGLVEAFKATLEETADADLLIHVLDAADPECDIQHETTRAVLAEIGVGEAKSLVVYNKIDRIQDRTMLEFMAKRHPEAVFISARTGEGLAGLRDAIGLALAADASEMRLLIPPSEYAVVAMLYREASILSEEHLEEGTLLHCMVPLRLAPRMQAYSFSSLT